MQTIFEPPAASCCLIGQKTSHLEAGSRPHLHDSFRNVVTRDEAKALARLAISTDAELIDYHLRAYSEEKIGFLGTHLCLVVAARRRGCDEIERRSFFVKTVPFDVPAQAAYIEEKGCFRKESDFFKRLVPILDDGFKGEAWAPRCFIAKEHTLIFEDMKFKGFSNRPRLFDEKTMRSAVACLARFHATSLITEERLNGKPLNKLFPELMEETEFKRTGRSYTWFEVAVRLAISIAEDLGLDSSRVSEASERVFDIADPSTNKRNVVSHGDLWSSNLIFDGEDRCCLVDFQLVRYSPLAHDVMQLLYLCSTREFRNKHEAHMLQHYYKVLRETLETNDFGRIVPGYEEILESAKEQRLPALVTAMIFHPTVLMDGKVAAEIMDDPVTYEEYYFVNRKPFVDEIMKKDPEYEKRIKDSVKELVEMSLILDSLPRPS